MQRNFDLVLSNFAQAMSSMVKALRTAMEKDTLGLPNEKNIDFRYPVFEIFSFLVSQLWALLITCQEEHILLPLFNLVFDEMTEALGLREKRFLKTFRKRFDEYLDIWFDTELENGTQKDKLSQCFVDNWTYSILENNLFDWEGETKPIPVLDAIRLFAAQLIYKELLSPVETIFLTTTRCLFQQNPDITKLTKKEIRNAKRNAMRKIERMGLYN